MKQQTWIDKITDESNLWLNAVKHDESGNLMEAHSLYLKDAAISLKQNSLLYAALSYSCAANCLKRAGKQDDARKLYLDAAKTYQQYAEATKSLREDLWALLQAYDHALLASDAKTLREVEEKYITLKLKVDPFSDEEKIINSLRLRKDRTDVSQNSNLGVHVNGEEKKLEQKELEIATKEQLVVSTITNTPEVIQEPAKKIPETIPEHIKKVPVFLKNLKFHLKSHIEPETNERYYLDLYRKNTEATNHDILNELYKQYRNDLQNKDLFLQISAISKIIDEQIKESSVKDVS